MKKCISFVFGTLIGGCLLVVALRPTFGAEVTGDDEGWRTALVGKKVVMRTCDDRSYSRAVCWQFARDFVASSNVESLVPEFTTTSLSELRRKAQIESCKTDTLDHILQLEAPPIGIGRAEGPFTVYRTVRRASASSDEVDQLLVQIRGYAAAGDNAKSGDMYGWSHYFIIEPKTCL